MEHQCKPGCDHSTTEIGIHYNLYQKIDKDRVECLNECQEGSGVTVFKAWEERLDREKVKFIYLQVYCNDFNKIFHFYCSSYYVLF